MIGGVIGNRERLEWPNSAVLCGCWTISRWYDLIDILSPNPCASRSAANDTHLDWGSARSDATWIVGAGLESVRGFKKRSGTEFWLEGGLRLAQEGDKMEEGYDRGEERPLLLTDRWIKGLQWFWDKYLMRESVLLARRRIELGSGIEDDTWQSSFIFRKEWCVYQTDSWSFICLVRGLIMRNLEYEMKPLKSWCPQIHADVELEGR